MKFLKISVVTISFNQSKYLLSAIKSILDQNYSNLEYIIVDAGSDDGSREIILDNKKYFKKIIFEDDDGPSDGLNKGFSYANGDIYGYLNSDDILLPGVLEKVNAVFQNNRVDVVSGHGFMINEDSEKIKQIFSHKFSLKQYLYQNCVVVQPSTFFLASIFKSVNGFNKKNKIAWDGELMVDFSKANSRFLIKHQFWSGFRMYSNSITGSVEYKNKLNKDYERLRNIHHLSKPHSLIIFFYWMLNWLTQPITLTLRIISIFKY